MRYTARTIALSLVVALGGSAAAGATVFQEDFAGGFPGNWTIRNNSSPVGTGGWGHGPTATQMWSRVGDRAFAASSFEAAGFASEADSASVVSDWLISPPVPLANGDRLSFAATAYFDQSFPDRLQLRFNYANAGTDVGTSAGDVGDFSFLALDVNSQYASDPADGAFPVEWTDFSYQVSGLPEPTIGRFAFRYLLTDTGWQGNEIGIDDVRLTGSVAVAPEPAAAGVVVVALAAAACRRPRRRDEGGHRAS